MENLKELIQEAENEYNKYIKFEGCDWGKVKDYSDKLKEKIYESIEALETWTKLQRILAMTEEGRICKHPTLSLPEGLYADILKTPEGGFIMQIGK